MTFFNINNLRQFLNKIIYFIYFFIGFFFFFFFPLKNNLKDYYNHLEEINFLKQQELTSNKIKKKIFRLLKTKFTQSNWRLIFKLNYLNYFFFKLFFFFIDLLYAKFFKLLFSINHNFVFFLMDGLNSLKNNTKKYFIGFGLVSFFEFFLNWFFPIFVGLFIFYLLLYIHSVSFSKIFGIWILIFLFFYWTISTFVFFIKKYYYSKFTTANQRFWKRSLILFWIIELFLFFIFFYLTLNANSESFFMLDQIQLFKNFLSPVLTFFFSTIVVSLIIFLCYILLLNLKWQPFSKLIFFFLSITYFFFYILFNEFYQFFNIINFYNTFDLFYDFDASSWVLDLEIHKTRPMNHYISLLIILKFWHIIFIFGCWLFFLLRSLETKRFRYVALSSNLQNFLFLFIFSWILFFPWLKFIFKHQIDYSYYWFFVNFRNFYDIAFFNELKLYYFSFLNFSLDSKFYSYTFNNFYYWFFYFNL